MIYSVQQYGQLNDRQRLETVEIFVDGFGHLMNFSKDREILKTLFLRAMNHDYVYVLVEGGTALGLLGIATNKLRPVKLNIDTCKKLFGNLKGSIICKQVNAIFQGKVVKEDTDVYIDFLATEKQSRCRGIATKLLQFSFELKGYENYYLEVFSENINAKRLYENIGFKAYKNNRFSPLAFQGYGYPIKMIKSMSVSNTGTSEKNNPS